MAYAIVETSGTQLRVEPGRFYDVNRLHSDEDASITLDKVLYVENDGAISIGQPFVEGATVEAIVERHLRGRKVIVYKMQPKKKTRKKRGHRQELTRVMITGIKLNGELISGESNHVAPQSSSEPENNESAPEAADVEAADVTNEDGEADTDS